MCAKESPAVIAYADTLIRADFDLTLKQTLLFLSRSAGSLWRSKAK
jgi:hypothetical protein